MEVEDPFRHPPSGCDPETKNRGNGLPSSLVLATDPTRTLRVDGSALGSTASDCRRAPPSAGRSRLETDVVIATPSAPWLSLKLGGARRSSRSWRSAVLAAMREEAAPVGQLMSQFCSYATAGIDGAKQVVARRGSGANHQPVKVTQPDCRIGLEDSARCERAGTWRAPRSESNRGRPRRLR